MSIELGLPEMGAHVPEREAALSRRELLGITLPWFALNFQFAALLPIVIPAQILLFVAPGSAGNAQQALFLGGMAALGAITALVLQPTIGALSDRTYTRLGRRRPYMLAGACGLLVGLSLLAITHVVALFVTGLFIVVVANTISGTACQGLVPDCVPARQRGAASGYMGLMTMLGTLGSLAVASVLLGQSGHGGSATAGIAHGASLFYALAAGVLVVGATVSLIAVKEHKHLGLRAGAREGAEWGNSEFKEAPAKLCEEKTAVCRRVRLVRLWLDPWRHANFTWVFLTRAFVMLGLALFTTYIEYYFVRVAHVTSFVQATAINAILALLGAVCSTLLVGVLSDRMQRRAPIVCGAAALMALAALTFVIAPGRVPLWPLGIVFGLGYGAYMSVDVALAVDALPTQRDAGKDLGLWSMASTLPAIVAPLVGSVVIFLADRAGQTALGYRGVFAIATLFLALGSVLVLKVRESHRQAEPAPDAPASAEPALDASAEDEPDVEAVAV